MSNASVSLAQMREDLERELAATPQDGSERHLRLACKLALVSKLEGDAAHTSRGWTRIFEHLRPEEQEQAIDAVFERIWTASHMDQMLTADWLATEASIALWVMGNKEV